MISYTTYQDVIDHGIDYLGGTPSDQVLRDVNRAALEAYRDIANAANWSYFYTHSRIITSGAFDGSQNNATIQYQATGGAYPNQVTITGSTWPDWAAEGTYLRCSVSQSNPPFVENATDMVAYRVKERKSATILTLDPIVCPSSDLPSGTEFILYRDTYLLPEDYKAQDQALYERNFGGMDYTHPREWLYENRYVFAMGVPQAYTITGDPQYPGRLVMKIYPWPYENKSIDFVYQRRPRPLLTAKYVAGKVSGTAGLNTLTGTGTNFTPAMVGSVIRLAANGATKPPTSLIMGNPPAFETYISDWISATSVALGDLLDDTYASVPYIISDMVDLEQGAMLNAYLRCVEMHLGMNRTLKDKPSARLQYQAALAEAKSADSRSFAGRAVSQNRPLRRRLRDYPINLQSTD